MFWEKHHLLTRLKTSNVGCGQSSWNLWKSVVIFDVTDRQLHCNVWELQYPDNCESINCVDVASICCQVKLNILFFTAVVLLMPGLHGILAAGVPVYGVLLMTMIWRATARVQFFEVIIIIIMIFCHRFYFFLVLLLLIQWWTPPLRLQDSTCSTFLMMCDVPSMARRGCTRMDNIRNDEVWYKEN
jgi:hypothetical protein